MSRDRLRKTISDLTDRIETFAERRQAVRESIPVLTEQLNAAIVEDDDERTRELREQIATAKSQFKEIEYAVMTLTGERDRAVRDLEDHETDLRFARAGQVRKKRATLAGEIDQTIRQLGQQTDELTKMDSEIAKLEGTPGSTLRARQYALRNAFWHGAGSLCKLIGVPAPFNRTKIKPLADALGVEKERAA